MANESIYNQPNSINILIKMISNSNLFWIYMLSEIQFCVSERHSIIIK